MEYKEIYNKRIMIYNMFCNDIINKQDIEIISNLSFKDIENLNNNYKNKILFSIYTKPYLLCNDNMFMNDRIIFMDIHMIADILIKRYNMEIGELKHQCEEGYISYEEYNKLNHDLYYLYFDSSIVGRRIYNLYNNDIVCDYLKKKDKCAKIS